MAIVPVHTTRKPSAAMNRILCLLPKSWVDDGLTMFPDSILGWSIAKAGTVHDAQYCSRIWPAGAMSVSTKQTADSNLKTNVQYLLPWGLKWVGWITFLGVYRGGYGSFNSCGLDACIEKEDRSCRHGVSPPMWMK